MKLSINPNYKRIYYLTYIMNIIGGLFFVINNYIVKGFDINAIVVIIIACIINLLILVVFFRKRKNVSKLDLMFMWCYITYVITFLLLSLIYQKDHFYTYNIIYFKNYMIVPYLVYLIEGLLVENNKFTNKK